ncbi:ribosomal protein L11 methyltransferase [Salinicoccus sediminis]|uniref:Ribosomal protein L11 methyltransferase n=1 Tax=Salinicoccus sediminis TaxID=1432562 RepID=A0A0M2SR66_9STAP|nr:50S ribosomal protein L11 methyltransferase [Salinicoccus sediminis]KKK35462.1 ribosomal protein L11 methyltransferase [Salinicoccus sediminis]
MKWHEVSISTTKANEDAFSLFLNEIAKGISVEHSLELLKEDVEDFDDKYRLDPDTLPKTDIRILVYFDETEDIEARLAEIHRFMTDAGLERKEDIHVESSIIDEEDWENEWKKYFHSFRVSDNFVIVPSWEIEDYEFREDDRLIKLDPGMAFGTGDHPTTGMCLKFIERTVRPEHKIIDVGTGSGILTIGAHLMGARDLKATDIDELSLKVARENFELNECAGDVTVETGDLLTSEDDQYDIVIANILAHIIDQMIDDAFETLKFGGVFIASGIITKRRDDIIQHMEAAGFNIAEVLEENGWVSIMARKA